MPSPVDNVGRWTAERARLQPARFALADEARRLDWAAFDARCARAAGWLAGRGIGRGDRIALLLGNRSATLELVFAAARLGAIATPLNLRLAAPELAELLADCRPALLCHEHELAPLAERAAAALPGLPRLAVGGDPDAYEAALAASEPRARIESVPPEAPMILMYTSGTTGVPKGALLPHRKTLFNSLNAQLYFPLSERDRLLVVVPLFHSFGLQILSIPAIYTGAGLVLQRRFDAEAVWQAVASERITLLGGVPTMFGALLETLRARRPDVSSLRSLFSAGSAIPVERIHAFEAEGLRLKQGFGQTESSVLCCLDADDAVRKAGSVGRPVFHAELRIVRREDLALAPERWRDCAPGETGEIVVRGPIVMLGYWERPEATAEAIRPGGWLVTGDLGSFDEEGFVTLTGRSKDLFISGGENVYPPQVEAVFETHPDVAEIAVVGMPDERFGEVGLAYVVPAPGAQLDPEALRRWGREQLAAFKVPARFVAVAALPRTATGKVQKHRLRGGLARAGDD